MSYIGHIGHIGCVGGASGGHIGQGVLEQGFAAVGAADHHGVVGSQVPRGPVLGLEGTRRVGRSAEGPGLLEAPLPALREALVVLELVGVVLVDPKSRRRLCAGIASARSECRCTCVAVSWPPGKPRNQLRVVAGLCATHVSFLLPSGQGPNKKSGMRPTSTTVRMCPSTQCEVRSRLRARSTRPSCDAGSISSRPAQSPARRAKNTPAG